jgi:hypothetical protein
MGIYGTDTSFFFLLHGELAAHVLMIHMLMYFNLFLRGVCFLVATEDNEMHTRNSYTYH